MSWARACFQLVVVRPWMRRVCPVRLFAGLPASEALGGAFVFDVADGEPQEFDGSFFAGEMPAVLGDFTQLVVQRFDSIGGVHDAAQHGRERQERREALPGGNRLGVACSQVAGRKLFQRPSGGASSTKSRT